MLCAFSSTKYYNLQTCNMDCKPVKGQALGQLELVLVAWCEECVKSVWELCSDSELIFVRYDKQTGFLFIIKTWHHCQSCGQRQSYVDLAILFNLIY